jgi:DNA-binding response OmpR family regulator
MFLRLQGLGHRVRHVGGGWGLLDLFRPGDCDLVVSDLEMPAGDGLTAAEAIREAGTTPIVLMSGRWTEDFRARAAAVEAVCLEKPFDLASLAATITAVTTGPPADMDRVIAQAHPRPSGELAARLPGGGQPG